MNQTTALDPRIVAGSRVLVHGSIPGKVIRVINREGARGGLVEVLRDGETRGSRRFRDGGTIRFYVGGFELGDTVTFIG